MARIYWRSHGEGPPRAWGDFTSLGHGREPLIEPGSPKRLGTTSPTVAAKVLADRVKELEQVKVDRAVLGVERRMTLGAFVPQHLALRRQEATVTELWLKETEARGKQLRYSKRHARTDRLRRAVTCLNAATRSSRSSHSAAVECAKRLGSRWRTWTSPDG